MMKKYYTIVSSFFFHKEKLSFKLIGWTDNYFVAREFFYYNLRFDDDVDIHEYEESDTMSFLLLVKKYYQVDILNIMDLKINIVFSNDKKTFRLYREMEKDLFDLSLVSEDTLRMFVDDIIEGISFILEFINLEECILYKLYYKLIKFYTRLERIHENLDVVYYRDAIGHRL